MKPALISYLACPVCRGSLRIAAEVPAGNSEHAALECSGCAAAYLVRDGIPRFPIVGQPDTNRITRQTQKIYDVTWQQFGRLELEEQWEKDSYAYLRILPSALWSGATRVGLDAGCGNGADIRRLSAGGATLIGVDVSAGVEVANEVTCHLPNVHIVQADLHHLPFAPHTFDFIYSFGVLHHLPDPKVGFVNLARLLKPGAPLITYLYEDFSDRSHLERALLGAVRGIRRVTSRVAPEWLYVLCWLLTPIVWSLCSLPAWLLQRCGSPLAERMPFRHTLRWPVLAADLFDRFAPPLEWRFSREGVLRLYEVAGLEQVEIRRYRGWVSWGFKPSNPAIANLSAYDEKAARAAG